jgi:hypothetical protein
MDQVNLDQTSESAGEPPLENTLKNTRKAIHGRFGHNSQTRRPEDTEAHNDALRQNSDAVSEKNVNAETFLETATHETIAERVGQAQQAVDKLHQVTIDSDVSIEPVANLALAAIFNAIWTIYNQGAQKSFCERHHIVPHGNTRGEFQPMVVYYWRSYHQAYVRQTVWRTSAVITVAMHDRVLPVEFASWIEQRGIDSILAQYKAIQSGAAASTADPASEQALAESILADPNSVPVVSGSATTRGFKGLALATVSLDSSLSGDYKLLAVLPHTEQEVRKLLVAVARKKATSK